MVKSSLSGYTTYMQLLLIEECDAIRPEIKWFTLTINFVSSVLISCQVSKGGVHFHWQ